MKRLKRKEWNDIKNLESVDFKVAGKSCRVIYCPETNLMELVVDHDLLRGCNQTENAEPIIRVEGFGYPS